MMDLTSDTARRIIDTVGGQGTPPEFGFQYFTAGLDDYLDVLDEEYLASYVRDGGAVFKMVIGVYGGGKTHFIYTVRDLAWKHNFVVSYVRLSPTECPFHKLELVYRSIADNLVPPQSPEELMSGYERGLPSLLRSWYGQKLSQHRAAGMAPDDLETALLMEIDNIGETESISFSRAVKGGLHAIARRDDMEFDSVSQWLKGEGYDRRIHGGLGILERIDKSTAFKMLRSLLQFVRHLGFSGLVICFDETELTASLATKQRELHLSNLRELIDECGHTNFQGAMLLYAVPNEGFLDGRTMVYEALRQRVDTVFEDLNPTGVKIHLDRAVGDEMEFLTEVGVKLADVYQVAYDCRLEASLVEETVANAASYAFNKRFGDIGYKRLFVQTMVRGLHYLKRRGTVPTLDDLGAS